MLDITENAHSQLIVRLRTCYRILYFISMSSYTVATDLDSRFGRKPGHQARCYRALS